MPSITQSVDCPLPGFEQVTIVFDMLAPEQAADKLYQLLGRDKSHEGIVVRVEGWDDATYGPDPFDYKRAPMAWRAWACRTAYATALTQFLTDPKFSMAWTRSTPPITTDAM